MNHTEIVNELGRILRGDHPGWEGDRRANGYAFLARIVRDMPDEAKALGVDIARNVSDFAEETGVSPGTLRLAARVLLGDLDGGPL